MLHRKTLKETKEICPVVNQIRLPFLFASFTAHARQPALLTLAIFG